MNPENKNFQELLSVAGVEKCDTKVEKNYDIKSFVESKDSEERILEILNEIKKSATPNNLNIATKQVTKQSSNTQNKQISVKEKLHKFFLGSLLALGVSSTGNALAEQNTDKISGGDNTLSNKDVKEKWGGIEHKPFTTENGLNVAFIYGDSGDIQKLLLTKTKDYKWTNDLLSQDYRAKVIEHLQKIKSHRDWQMQIDKVQIQANELSQYNQVLSSLEENKKEDSKEANFLRDRIQKEKQRIINDYGNVFK